MQLSPRILRQLTIDPASYPRGLSFLTAASGLVRHQGRFYVVADDEQHLAIFDSATAAPGRLIRLFEGDLPASPKERKALKGDLEALLLLPRMPDWPSGALLALGSGSRPNRNAGALLALDARATRMASRDTSSTRGLPRSRPCSCCVRQRADKPAERWQITLSTRSESCNALRFLPRHLARVPRVEGGACRRVGAASSPHRRPVSARLDPPLAELSTEGCSPDASAGAVPADCE